MRKGKFAVLKNYCLSPYGLRHEGRVIVRRWLEDMADKARLQMKKLG